MKGVTLKLLHGADRGKVYEDLRTPFTVGREEGNDVQLNDERVSRCHFKIQRDNDRLVLTDLESTNGTKVNGTECQLKILRSGDLIAVGRSLMLVGSDSEIADRLAAINNENPTISRDLTSLNQSGSIEMNESLQSALAEAQGGIPPIPDGLSAGQKAQFCEILDFLQSRLHQLIESARSDEARGEVTMQIAQWQELLETQSQLAAMTRRIADPEY
ncbi:MAG: FHA domain-containing protein [Planctomycetota bacterium]